MPSPLDAKSFALASMSSRRFVFAPVQRSKHDCRVASGASVGRVGHRLNLLDQRSSDREFPGEHVHAGACAQRERAGS